MANSSEQPFATLQVQVKPRSSRCEVLGFENGRLVVKISAPPVEGQANEQLRELVAKTLGVAKSKVEIVGGKTSRQKTLKIAGLNQDKIESIVTDLKSK